jgi:hypothetical protein
VILSWKTDKARGPRFLNSDNSEVSLRARILSDTISYRNSTSADLPVRAIFGFTIARRENIAAKLRETLLS